MNRLVIYANCLIYGWVAVGFSRGLASVITDPGWQQWHGASVRVGYAAIEIISIVITLPLLGGLLLKKEWSRQLAMSWNLFLAVIIGVVPSLAIALVLGTEWVRRLADRETLVRLLLALLLVFLTVRLRTAAARAYFGDADAKSV